MKKIKVLISILQFFMHFYLTCFDVPLDTINLHFILDEFKSAPQSKNFSRDLENYSFGLVRLCPVVIRPVPSQKPWRRSGRRRERGPSPTSLSHGGRVGSDPPRGSREQDAAAQGGAERAGIHQS